MMHSKTCFKYGIPGEDIYYRSHDDLLLYVRKYGSDDLPARPAICLAGITRNCRDAHALAMALASHPTHPRPVYCLDYRGRGHSQWDKDWQNYSPYIELLDVASFLTLKGLTNTAVIGTSRGGIIAMMLAVMRPAAIGCAVLNDVGPVIETSGLARIMGYCGKIPVPQNWNEAKRVVFEVNKHYYAALDDAGWERITRQVFNEDGGRPAAGYDPNISKALSEIDISKPMPTMWEHFDALKRVPLMVIRGEHSDILSQATFQEMQDRHPNCTGVLVRNEGHPPLLFDRFTQRLVEDFLINADRTWQNSRASSTIAIKDPVEV